MKYTKVYMEAIGYELAPVVVTSSELEDRIKPLYKALHIPEGQIEALTGIRERRWWNVGTPVSEGAIAAAHKALAASNVKPDDIGVLIYAAVCRENFEPATACRVADGVGVSPSACVYDISNACLGVLNGIVEIANRIELGQVKAGLVVSCETAREITEVMIERMLEDLSMDIFKGSLTTLTGGSGAVAVLLTDGSFTQSNCHRFLGGVSQVVPKYYDLCHWGIEEKPCGVFRPIMLTDAVSVLKHGTELGLRTWKKLLEKLDWADSGVDKVICHQIGSEHRELMLKLMEIPKEKDFSTYEYLGNMGTVALPVTAALAEERDFLKPGDRIGFLGIGSGLNCIMLGWEW